MPNRFPVAEAADSDAVFDYIRNDRDFRTLAWFLPGMHRRGGGGFAKTPRERDEFIIVQFLCADQQHQIIEKRALHGTKRRVIKRAHVTATYFGADLCVEWTD